MTVELIEASLILIVVKEDVEEVEEEEGVEETYVASVTVVIVKKLEVLRDEITNGLSNFPSS